MQKKRNWKLIIAVLSVFFLQKGTSSINPIIADVIAAYPDIPQSTVKLVSTVSALLAVPATIITGAIVGKYVKYRTLLLTGIILFIGAGITPYFVDSFALILIARAAFGIGVGILLSLGSALVVGLFEGQERATIMGWGNSIITNLGGVLLTTAVGYMATKNWKNAFLIYAVGLIALALVFFIPEPDVAQKTDRGEKPPKMNSIVYLYMGIIILAMAFLNLLLLNMSQIIINEGLGTAATAGTVLSMFTIGGMVSGFVFSYLMKSLKQNLIPFAFGLLAITMATMAFGHSIMFLYIASVLGGFSISLLLPAMIMNITPKIHPAQAPFASSLIVSGLSIGGFIAVYIEALITKIFGVSGDLRFSFYVGLVIYVVAMILFFFLNKSRNKITDTN